MIQIVLLFIAAFVAGHLLIRSSPATLEPQVKVAYESAIRGLFYAPTIVVGGHGIAPVPTVAGLVMAAGPWEMPSVWLLLPAVIVAALSVFLSVAERGPAPDQINRALYRAFVCLSLGVGSSVLAVVAHLMNLQAFAIAALAIGAGFFATGILIAVHGWWRHGRQASV